jgi:hypothetical protein
MLLVYGAPTRQSEHWLTSPRVPGSIRFRPEVRAIVEQWPTDSVPLMASWTCICRGPYWMTAFRQDVAGGYRHYEPYLFNQLFDLPGTEVHLYVEGREIAPASPGAPMFDVGLLPAGPARYRLTRVDQPVEPFPRYPSQVTRPGSSPRRPRQPTRHSPESGALTKAGWTERQPAGWNGYSCWRMSSPTRCNRTTPHPLLESPTFSSE